MYSIMETFVTKSKIRRENVTYGDYLDINLSGLNTVMILSSLIAMSNVIV